MEEEEEVSRRAGCGAHGLGARVSPREHFIWYGEN
jgi:hypothetical protein